MGRRSGAVAAVAGAKFLENFEFANFELPQIFKICNVFSLNHPEQKSHRAFFDDRTICEGPTDDPGGEVVLMRQSSFWSAHPEPPRGPANFEFDPPNSKFARISGTERTPSERTPSRRQAERTTPTADSFIICGWKQDFPERLRNSRAEFVVAERAQSDYNVSRANKF